MKAKFVVLEAILLTTITFLVVSLSDAEAYTLCLLYVSVIVLAQSVFYPAPVQVETVKPPVKNAVAMLPEVVSQSVVRAVPQSGRYYAVATGLQTGIYNSWDECAPQVVGVKGAIHKSFATREQAEEFMHHKR